MLSINTGLLRNKNYKNKNFDMIEINKNFNTKININLIQ